MTPTATRRPDCRLCRGTDLERVVELTPTPPANALVPPAHADRPTAVFPLDVYLCGSCGHAQLLDVVDAGDLFGDYRYLTGTSPSLIAYADEYATDLLATTGLGAGARVLEIGSNDGTQLAAFARRGLVPLGADPAARPVGIARERGVDSLLGFFGPALRDDVLARAPFDLVVGNNVLAHIDDLEGVVDLVHDALAPEGWLVFEVGYLGDVVADRLFDVIYHEHVDYHSVTPLPGFFARLGLAVVRVERSRMQGGSIRVFVRHADAAGEVDPSVSRFLAEESRAGLDRPATFAAFTADVDRLRADLRELVLPWSAEGRRIWGFGAAAKATTLLYHFGLGEVIEAIVDDNPAKQGLLTPGHHIPVLAPTALLEQRPDHVVVFAWNYADHVRRSHQDYLAGGGSFVVPLPELSVVTE